MDLIKYLLGQNMDNLLLIIAAEVISLEYNAITICFKKLQLENLQRGFMISWKIIGRGSKFQTCSIGGKCSKMIFMEIEK